MGRAQESRLPAHARRSHPNRTARPLSPLPAVEPRDRASPHRAARHFQARPARLGLEPSPAAAELAERPAVRYSGEFETLRPADVLALVRAAASPQDAAIYLTAVFSGLRPGELRALG